MTVKRVEFTYKKPSLPLQFDNDKNVWFGYRVDIRANGKRRRPVFKTKTEADKYVEAVQRKRKYDHAGIEIVENHSLRISQLFNRRLTFIKNEKERTRATRVFAAFKEAVGDDLPVNRIETEHFEIFNAIRLETGVKPQTVSREDTVLSTAFRRAREMFPLELKGYKPAAIARPSYKKRKKKKRIIEPDEKDAIIRSILEDRLPREHAVRTSSRTTVAAMFEVAWMLGLRFSEVRNLLKTDLKAKAKTLRVVRTKTGDVDTLEFVPDRVIDILQSSSSQTKFVFELACSEHTYVDILKRACEANSIPYGRSEIDGVTFHSTRHSFTTRMTEVAGLGTTQSYTGHSNAEMVTYYSQATKKSKRLAMEKLYGSNEENMREVYDKIRSGKLSFEAFLEAIGQ